MDTMNTESIRYPKNHHGRNIKRLRDILGVKQEVIATELDMTQQAISKMEQREQIEDELLDKIAQIMKIPVEAIKNFNEEATVSFVANTFYSHENSIGSLAYQYNFNPIDKILELYERMLKTEQEKVAMLQKIVDKK